MRRAFADPAVAQRLSDVVGERVFLSDYPARTPRGARIPHTHAERRSDRCAADSCAPPSRAAPAWPAARVPRLPGRLAHGVAQGRGAVRQAAVRRAAAPAAAAPARASGRCDLSRRAAAAAANAELVLTVDNTSDSCTEWKDVQGACAAAAAACGSARRAWRGSADPRGGAGRLQG